MMTLLRSTLIVPAFALALGAVAVETAEAQTAALDRVMSPEERVATGVARLSASECAALEAWLARYTATVSSAVQGLVQPAGVPVNVPRSQPQRPQEREVDPHRGYDTIHPRTIAKGARLFRSTGGGTFVMLEDGTMWEIYLPHRPETATWQQGDFVQVRRDVSPVNDYEHQLVSAPGSTRVSARFAGFVRIGEPAEGR